MPERPKVTLLTRSFSVFSLRGHAETDAVYFSFLDVCFRASSVSQCCSCFTNKKSEHATSSAPCQLLLSLLTPGFSPPSLCVCIWCWIPCLRSCLLESTLVDFPSPRVPIALGLTCVVEEIYFRSY